jgi:hypothetical protein
VVIGRSTPLKIGETKATGSDDERDLEAPRAGAEFLTINILHVEKSLIVRLITPRMPPVSNSLGLMVAPAQLAALLTGELRTY